MFRESFYNGHQFIHKYNSIDIRNKITTFMDKIGDCLMLISFPKVMVLASSGDYNYYKNRLPRNGEYEVITDVDAFIESKLRLLYTIIKDEYNDDTKKLNLYEKILKSKYDKTEDSNKKELYYLIVGAVVKCQTFEEFKNYMAIANKISYSDILDYFNSNYNYKLLERLLKESSFYKNLTDGQRQELKEIIRKISEDKIDTVSMSSIEPQEKLCKSITRASLEVTFKSFLIYIDPSGEWLNIYNEGRKSEDILFYDINIDGIDYSGIYNNKIKLFCQGDVGDLIRLAYEFAHFVFIKKHGDKESFIKEFAPIYYEEEMYNFLQMFDYDKDYLNKHHRKRAIEINNYYKIYFPLLKVIFGVERLDENTPNESIEQFIKILLLRKNSVEVGIYHLIGKFLVTKFKNKDGISQEMKAFIENPNNTDFFEIYNHFSELKDGSKMSLSL